MQSAKREKTDIEGLSRVDDRGRILLGKEFAGKYFKKEMDAEGRLTLVSYVAIPERELWLQRHPEAMASLDEGIRQLEKGEGVLGYNFLDDVNEDEDTDDCPTT